MRCVVLKMLNKLFNKIDFLIPYIIILSIITFFVTIVIVFKEGKKYNSPIISKHFETIEMLENKCVKSMLNIISEKEKKMSGTVDVIPAIKLINEICKIK